MNNNESKCPRCNSLHTIRKGRIYTSNKSRYRYRYLCVDCKKSFLGELIKNEILPPPFKYISKEPQKRDWSAYNQYQTNEREITMNLISELLQYIPIDVQQSIGRPTINPKEMLFCMLYKTYYQLSSRRLVSDLQLAQKTGFITKTPSYSSVMNYFNDNRFKTILSNMVTLSSSPINQMELDTAIDSSGFSTSKFGHWFNMKWGKSEDTKRIFRKAHIVVDTKTNIILSANITDQHGGLSGDSSNFQPLLKKAVMNFRVNEISADKAYSSRENYEYANKYGVKAYIPFKSNAKGTARGSYLWRKMYDFFNNKPQEFLESYHKRSNVETTFFQIKQKFGGNLMTKNYIANVNEIFCKLVCHNISSLVKAYFTLGLNMTFCTEAHKTNGS